MIGFITGTIVHTSENYIIVQTGGIGYKTYTISQTRVKEIGSNIDLWTYLAVRENALDLYGFEDKEELAMFELLLTVSGIGPRSALSALDTAGVTSLKRSVSQSNPALLTKISGIGKKTAEKIVLELKGKLTDEYDELVNKNSNSETIDALVSLGYSERQAREAFEQIPEKDAPTTELIKEALKYIG